MNPADLTYTKVSEWQRKAMIAGAIGAVALLIGFFIDRHQFLRSYLFAYLFWTGVAIGCLGILLLHNVVGGRWGMVIRRLCEAGARTLVLMGALLIPILLGIHVLYEWAHEEPAHDPIIQEKTAYLNVPFFVVRAVIYFAIWWFFAYRSTRWSTEQDRSGDPSVVDRARSFSAPALVVFVLTTTFAFIDWIMSLEPHWFSTIYGAMFLIGNVLQAFAILIAIVLVLSRKEPLASYVSTQHVHDLGNLMFAFTMLWAYLSFSQFLIIWSGNLPEEIPWYIRRLHGGWGLVALALVIFHFAIPFVVLLQRLVKRAPNLLLKMCFWMLAIRIVDVYWIVMPAFHHVQEHISWMDIAAPVAIGGIWGAEFLRQVRTMPLVPLKDPRLAEIPRPTVAY